MSVAMEKAIYARLTGLEDLSAYTKAAAAQLVIQTLLGVDLDTNAPAVYANKNQGGPSMPSITFRESGGGNDGRFFTSGIRMANEQWDFEYWDGPAAGRTDGMRKDGSDPDGSYIAPIRDAVEYLLDSRSAEIPPLVLDEGHLYDFEVMTDLVSAFLPQTQGSLYVGIQRYTSKEARY
jgi:hypothetical protein